MASVGAPARAVAVAVPTPKGCTAGMEMHGGILTPGAKLLVGGQRFAGLRRSDDDAAPLGASTPEGESLSFGGRVGSVGGAASLGATSGRSVARARSPSVSDAARVVGFVGASLPTGLTPGVSQAPKKGMLCRELSGDTDALMRTPLGEMVSPPKPKVC